MEKEIEIRKLICFVEDANGDSYCVNFDETNQGFHPNDNRYVFASKTVDTNRTYDF